MAFTWKRPEGRFYTYEDGARIIIEIAKGMGISDKGCIQAIACVKVESDFWIPGNHKDPSFNRNPGKFRHDSLSNDGLSVGWYQQQVALDGSWGWGGKIGDDEGLRKRMDPVESTKLFLNALKGLKYPDGSGYNSNFKSPGQMVADVQKCAKEYRHRYDQEWAWATDLFRCVTGTPHVPARTAQDAMLTPGPWRGDPIWIDEVLIAEGLNVKFVDGWDRDGHGDFKDVLGVVCHHTGGNATPVSEIVNGFPHLAGPLAQIHLGRDGTVTLCCVGVAWHAGSGGKAGVPRSQANWHMIGIEAVGLPPRNGRHREGWPDVQYDAYVKVCAAICRRLGRDASWVISHQEWDDGDPATDEGKWDPGSIDMNIFRRDVQHRIDSFKPGGAAPGVGVFMALSDQEQKELLDKTRQLWGALFNDTPLMSMYVPKGTKGKTKDMIAGIDGTTFNNLVEALARKGTPWAIEAVAMAAAGDGQFENDPWVVKHAQDLLVELGADRASVETLDD